MLRVSIHAGPLKGITRCNRVDWLDIGYDKLAAVADYKVVLFSTGVGATDVVHLRNYPRWSASLWDLTARAIALALSPAFSDAKEVVPPAPVVTKRAAFAEAMSAVIEHNPAYGNAGRRLAAMEVVRHGKTRGLYHARVDEDLQPSRSTVPFLFAPAYLSPAELILRAALVRLTGDHSALPPRPTLLVPRTFAVSGKNCVAIHRIHEPARTGFRRWLDRIGIAPIPHAGSPEGIAHEALFTRFLQEAV